MATTLKEWLKDKLINMVSIQHAVIGRDADITAFAWSGSQLRIYLIGEAVRTRSLKRTLQDATDVGVNTLFLVDARLLGENGKRINAQDWLLALHELTHERIYAFQIKNGAVSILPIHLEEVSGTGERKLWYGPAVNFERIRFYRHSVKQPRSIRGDWLVADFGNHAFWRNNDYRRYHAEKERVFTGSRNTHWQAWSGSNTWKSDDNTSRRNPNERVKSPLQARLEQCYELLGVPQSASKDEIKKAFRKRALAFHPDTSEMPQDKAEVAFRALNDAYDYIKASRGWS